MAHELAKAEYEKVETLWKEVRSMKKIKAFLESERCIPYADGLFSALRLYPTNFESHFPFIQCVLKGPMW